MDGSTAVLDWGLGMILWLQALPAWATEVMRLLSRLGDAETLVVVVPLVLWCVDAPLGLRTGALLLTYGACNTTAKNLFGLPRPYWVTDAVDALSAESSFGMPSAHAGYVVAALGRLAVAAGSVLRVALVALVLGISVSRIALGVHWPADVIGGWLLGGALLGASLLGERRLGPRLASWGVGRQVTAAAVLSMGLLAVAVAVVDARATGGVAAAWARTAAAAAPEAPDVAPFSLTSTVTASGALFGLLSGWALLERDGGLDAGGAAAARLGRYALGMTGVALLLAGGAVLPDPASAAGAVAIWGQLALAGWWIAHGAPSLFVRLGLAVRRPVTARGE